MITADGGWRRGKEVRLKTAVDEALTACPDVKDVIVYQRTGSDIPMTAGRDQWWHELDAELSSDPAKEAAAENCPAVELDSEHPLFVLYTSGTTGKPKGILHTTAGYLLQTAITTKWVFDLQEEDIYWCTADVGWVTGHSYVVYGPLAAGATCMMYEGAPDYPAYDRFWRLVEKYRVSIFYSSPTAIRALIRQGDHWPNARDLSSLRVLGSVGEPINPAAWEWYHRVIGKGRCPIVDTWWQTETGSIMISPLPGATPLKPGSGTLPLPGIIVDIVDTKGQPVGKNREGYSDHPASLAQHGSEHLGRSGTIPATVLVARSRSVFHRGCGASGRRWILLGAWPCRRCDERQRPPAQHHGNRVGARSPSRRSRSSRSRKAARNHGTGGLRVRHAKAGRLETRRTGERTPSMGRQRNRQRSPGPRSFGLRMRCPRPAAAKSCGDCCERL